MNSEPPVIMAHVSVGTNDFPRARDFYKAVLATIGAKVIMEVDVPGEVGAIAFGKMFPEFWVQTPYDKEKASVGNGTHFAFLATSKEMVQDFWNKALEMGATPDGEPGPRPHYGEAYYGCFLRDLDGNKIEAMYWGAHEQFKN